MKALDANVGSTATREVAPAMFIFAIAFMLFASQGLSTFLSLEVFGLKEGVVPIQVVLTFVTYATLQIFEPRFRFLAIISRHPVIFALLMGLFLLQLTIARSDWASPDEVKAPFQLLVGVCVFHLGFFLASNPKYLRTLFSALFFAVGLSGLVALFEFATGMSMPWARGGIVDRLVGEGAQGLEWFPVSYAYAVLPALVISTYYLFVPQAWYARPARALCLFALLFGSLGLVAASSRSGLVGLVLGASVAYLVSSNQLSRAKRWFSFCLILGPIAVVSGWALLSWLGKSDITEDARFHATYAVYLPLVITNPIGVTDRDLNQLSTFFDAQEKLGIELPLETVLLGTAIAPHNGIMTAGIQYGWLGIACCIAIFGSAIIRTYRSICASEFVNPPERHLQIALLGAIVALLVHAWFHNMTIFSGDMRNWLPLGLIFGCLNIGAVRSKLARMSSHKFQSCNKQMSYSPHGAGQPESYQIVQNGSRGSLSGRM